MLIVWIYIKTYIVLFYIHTTYFLAPTGAQGVKMCVCVSVWHYAKGDCKRVLEIENEF